MRLKKLWRIEQDQELLDEWATNQLIQKCTTPFIPDENPSEVSVELPPLPGRAQIPDFRFGSNERDDGNAVNSILSSAQVSFLLSAIRKPS